MIGLFANRMVQLQLREADAYLPLAEESQVKAGLLAPEQGRLLDRGDLTSYRAS